MSLQIKECRQDKNPITWPDCSEALKIKEVFKRYLCRVANFRSITYSLLMQICICNIFQLIELRRNPLGAIDKRTRTILKPMSKTRKDSTVSELEDRLKDITITNQKYRKQLLEKESELQVGCQTVVIIVLKHNLHEGGLKSF